MLFRVLGPLEVHGRDGDVHRLGRGKAATVLATLLQHPNVWVASSALIDATWHEAAAPASAEANLKTYVWRLRRTLPTDGRAPRIESAPGRYRVRVLPGELDTNRVTDHAARAADASAEGETVTAVEELEAALALWRGRPFEDVAGAVEESARLDALHGRLREDLGAAQLALGHAAEAVQTLSELTGDDPLRESAWARLVRALHADGRRADAMRAYRGARRVLATELGVCPGRELDAAYREVLGESGEPGGARGATAFAAPGQPRHELPPGPARLTARAAELAAIRRVRAGVVVVDGMPGAGKTALAVHAAHALAPRFPDGSLFVELGELDVSDALAGLLRRIGVADAFIPETRHERTALWRSELARRRVLLVLDGAGGQQQVSPLLPAGPGCLTVVTTRRRDWHVDGAVRIGLGPLGEDDAVTMVRSAVDEHDVERAVRSGDGPERTLARHSGGIPAVVRELTDRLRTRPLWTVGSLAAGLGDGEPCRVLTHANGYRDRLAAVVDALSAEPRAVLSAVADLPAEFDLAAAARAAGGDSERVRVVLEELVDSGLLDARTQERYRCHPFTAHAARCGRCAPAPVVRAA